VFARIGRFCVRRRWFVLAAWVLVVLGGGAAAGPVFAALDAGRPSDRLESVQGFDRLGENAVYGQRLILLVDDARIADPAVRAEITAAVRDIARIRDVGRVVDPYADPRLGLVATDGRAAVIVVDLARDWAGPAGTGSSSPPSPERSGSPRRSAAPPCGPAATRCSTGRSTSRSRRTPSTPR
jgi:hypothetical protein